jgi:hypothetical protein
MRPSLVLVLLAACVVQPASAPKAGYGGGTGYAQPPSSSGGGPGSGAVGASCGRGNIALGKPAQQSSTSQWSKPNDSQGGVDGQKTGSFGFHTNAETSPWWQVDLGASCALDQIVIYNRLDCCSERAATLQILISNDGGTWQTLYTHNGAPFGGVTDNRPLIVNATGRAARFVRLQLTANAYFHLDEVEIYGGTGSGVAQQPSPPPPLAPPAPPAPPATTPAPPVTPPPATVASCGSGNIALGKPARQSSTSQWSKPRNDSQGAVDGVKDGRWGFHTSQEAQPWWEVDLGRVCPVKTVRIFNRLDCCSERATSLQILVSRGDGSWEVAYKNDGKAFGGVTDGKPLVVDLGGRAAQVVRIQLTAPGNEYLHLDEVEIESR